MNLPHDWGQCLSDTIGEQTNSPGQVWVISLRAVIQWEPTDHLYMPGYCLLTANR